VKTVRWLAAYVVGSILVAFGLANGAAWLVTRSQCPGCADGTAAVAYGLTFVGTLSLALMVGLVILAVRLGLWADEPPR
jgi:hypothetical protein